MFRMVDIIEKKRDGGVLSQEEIQFFISEYVAGRIPDYQASALCMAIFFQGMDDEEMTDLTIAMAHSGDTLDLSELGLLSADKHSTGGVGDKTSLLVLPIVASCGGKLPKMSGRGLGHTGGTVDKLESIPGYQTDLSPQALIAQTKEVGLGIVGQTGTLTPADKKLYALRDVTATIDSIPLITSSIMSKKLAAGARNIVLDVKWGSGAFMKTLEKAHELAEKMVTIGKKSGRNTAAVLTDMNNPLGHCVGNALEVQEAISLLRGEESIHLSFEGGDPDHPTKEDIYLPRPKDLETVVLTLSSELLRMIFQLTPDEAWRETQNALTSGRAFQTFQKWIKAQGGDLQYILHPELFPRARCTAILRAGGSVGQGLLQGIDAASVGYASLLLGAGRAVKEDPIDHAAGIILTKKPGEIVHEGEVLAYLLTNNEPSLAEASKVLEGAYFFTRNQAQIPAAPPLVYQIVR